MKAITSIARFIYAKKKSVVLFFGRKDNQLNQIMRALVKEEIKEEKDLLQYFESDGKEDERIRNIKSKLRKGLHNAILIKDDYEQNDYRRKFHKNYKLFAVSRIIRGHLMRPAIDLAEQVLKLSLENNFNDTAVSMLEMLTIYYGSIRGDEAKLEEYGELFLKKSKQYHYECTASYYYTDVRLIFARFRVGYMPDEIKIKAEGYLKELERMMSEIESDYVVLIFYNVKVTIMQLENDYPGLIECCNEAANYFQKNEHAKATIYLFSFEYKKIPAYIQLKEYDNALKSIQRITEISSEGTYNWHVALQHQYILGFHSRNYSLSVDSIKVAEKGMKNIEQEIIFENWKIFEAYLYLFHILGKVTYQKQSKFRLYKLLNEAPVSEKDKGGSNINLLVLEFLFLLFERKRNRKSKVKSEDAIHELSLKLKRYLTSYLKGEEYFRTRHLFKCLIAVPDGSFNRLRISHRDKKSRKALKERPLDVARQGSEIEVVPFEDLLVIVDELLD